MQQANASVEGFSVVALLTISGLDLESSVCHAYFPLPVCSCRAPRVITECDIQRVTSIRLQIGNDQKRWSLTLCDGVHLGTVYSVGTAASKLGFVLVAAPYPHFRHVVKSVVVSEMARRLEEAQGNVIGLLRLDLNLYSGSVIGVPAHRLICAA